MPSMTYLMHNTANETFWNHSGLAYANGSCQSRMKNNQLADRKSHVPYDETLPVVHIWEAFTSAGT